MPPVTISAAMKDLVRQRWRTAAGTETWPLRLTVTRVAVMGPLYVD
jgi:hypothetical protein